jgi:hypothetical protein
MAFLRDGAVGDKEASPAQEIAEIAKIAEMTRSRPRTGVLVIESSGSLRNTCACIDGVRYLVMGERNTTCRG